MEDMYTYIMKTPDSSACSLSSSHIRAASPRRPKKSRTPTNASNARHRSPWDRIERRATALTLNMLKTNAVGTPSCENAVGSPRGRRSGAIRSPTTP